MTSRRSRSTGHQCWTDAVTFVFQDNQFNNGRAIAVTAVAPGTNTINVSPNNAAAVGGDLYVYIIDDGVQPAIGSLTNIVGGNQLRFAVGDPLGLNNPGGGSTFTPLLPAAACKRITWVTYFVNDDGVLIRRLYGQTATLVGAGVDNGGLGGIVPTGGGAAAAPASSRCRSHTASRIFRFSTSWSMARPSTTSVPVLMARAFRSTET